MKWYIMVTLASVVALSAECGRKGADDRTETPLEKPAIAVEAVTVTRGTLHKNIEGSGVIAGINEAYVVAETQGIIRSVHFELGDSVAAGQLLVEVDDRIAQLNMEQAEQQYETTKMNLSATEKLYKAGSASKAEWVQAQSAAKGAKAAYEAALKAYEDCSIKAPISGYVAHREPTITIGNFLAAGTRVARMVDISSLKLEVAVGEREISFIEEGASTTVLVPAACEQKVFEAQVKAVAAGSDPTTGSYTVVITWPNTCDVRIKSGMLATASIETRREEPVILIPTPALVYMDRRDAVYVAQKGRAAVRYVRIGRKMGNRIEILDGLEEGEVLVLSSLSNLTKGDRVAPSIIGESGKWR